jgi:ubiquinone/menaquinone biosynthesis C-methylase UbiE
MAVDTFAIKGNAGIAHGIKIYIENQKERLHAAEKIVILDIGPAIGALTAMLVLQELSRIDLLSKAKVILLDVSERVLQKTQERNFEFPETLIHRSLKTKIFSKLRTSKSLLASAHKIHLKDNSVDICTAGFLFHHLHDDIKKSAATEMQRVTKSGGFIGVAEEWFDNYEDYAAMHCDDEVPLAYESIISYRKLRHLFPQLEIFESHNPIKHGTKVNDNYYYFCGIKRGLGKGPLEVSKTRL